MTSGTERPNVLIVDDEERVANTYDLRLGDEYETEVVFSGEQAIQTVGEETDIILLDRRMPGMSGDDVLDQIRKRGLDCRVVMLTAVDPDFDIAEMDIDDYVVKPVDKETLQEVVDRAMTISRYNEQMQELSSLKLKRNVLEVELSGNELHESHKYQQLTEEIDSLEATIKEMEDTLDIEQFDLYL